MAAEPTDPRAAAGNLPRPLPDILAGLQRLADALGGSSSADDVLSAILRSSLDLCTAERGAILLFDARTREIVKTLIRSADGTPEGIDHQLNLVVAGWVHHHGRPYLTEDVLADQGYRNPTKATAILGPAAAFPLRADGQIIGVLHLVNRRNGRKFDQTTVDVGGIIGSLAAQFIDRAKFQERLFLENVQLKRSLGEQWGLEHILGSSSEIEEVKRKIPILAGSTANVLIIGETGTGKELISRSIHYCGPRAAKPFVAINCAAIPATLFESELFGHEKGAFTGAAQQQQGKFELADEGTLFLDEVSEMPLELQPKLLRAIETRTYYRIGSPREISVDVRLIAASSKDLAQEVRGNRFLEALYHRLNVLPMRIPPLRVRRGDIPVLASSYLLELSSGGKVFDEAALRFLSSLEWKGNVRELRNAVERASIFIDKASIGRDDLVTVLLEDELGLAAATAHHLREYIERFGGGENLLEESERKLIEAAIGRSAGNVAEAARILGIDRLALRRRMEKYRL